MGKFSDFDFVITDFDPNNIASYARGTMEISRVRRRFHQHPETSGFQDEYPEPLGFRRIYSIVFGSQEGPRVSQYLWNHEAVL